MFTSVCSAKKKGKKQERQTGRQKVSWQAAKCCLAHFQLEWCNSGLSSSVSYRSWKAALCFLGWLCSRWNVTIAGFISHLALKRLKRGERSSEATLRRWQAFRTSVSLFLSPQSLYFRLLFSVREKLLQSVGAFNTHWPCHSWTLEPD